MRIVNRQPLNFELLTLDDGSKKLACDLADLQQLLGVTALQDTIFNSFQQVSAQSSSSGPQIVEMHVGSMSGISINQSDARHRVPNLEDLIHLLDSRLPDCYEVVYKKQYASIVSRSALKRARVAIYIVKQQEGLALSIHNKILLGHQFPCEWCMNSDDDKNFIDTKDCNLFILPESREEFEIRICEMIESVRVSERIALRNPSLRPLDVSKKFSERFEEFWNGYYGSHFFLPSLDSEDSKSLNYWPVIEAMVQEELIYLLDHDQRFPGTLRFEARTFLELEQLIDEIAKNLQKFLETNGKEPIEQKWEPRKIKKSEKTFNFQESDCNEF